MSQTVFFKSDYTEATDNSPYGHLVYEFWGMKNPDAIFQMIHVKPGIYLSVCNQPAPPVPGMAFEVNNAPVSFSFLLSGTCRHRVRGLENRKLTEFNSVSGTNMVSTMHHITGDMDFSPDIPVICVDMKIDHRLLYAYIDERKDRLLKGLKGLLTPGRQVYADFPLHCGMASTVMDIIHPPSYTGITRSLFYESRALDLLTLQLEQMTSKSPLSSRKKAYPGKKDLERLHEARRLLVSDLKDPPTIASLARKCGLNEFKLKKGFKQAFNTTIFAYLQEVKMKNAWQLIQEGGLSVTEAAYEVGYTNISHFSAAFKKQFHLTPGVLKKAGRTAT